MASEAGLVFCSAQMDSVPVCHVTQTSGALDPLLLAEYSPITAYCTDVVRAGVGWGIHSHLSSASLLPLFFSSEFIAVGAELERESGLSLGIPRVGGEKKISNLRRDM